MRADFARPRRPGARRRTAFLAPLAVLGVVAMAAGIVYAGAQRASAAQAPVNLGTAASFSVLAGSTVTNVGPSVLGGNLGVSPGTTVTGFPPGTVGGTIYAGDSVSALAQSDLTAAYNDAASRSPFTSESGDLTGQTLKPGVYKSTSSLNLTGTVTLDAGGNPSAVFIFQIGSTLITGSGSDVALINGAQACNVFWQVGSSATLGTNSTFQGDLMALTSITADTGATVIGRLLARNGAVTLDTNTITLPPCTTSTATPSASASASTPPSPSASASFTPTGSPSPIMSSPTSPTPSPTASPSISTTASPSGSVIPTASPSRSVTPTTSPSSSVTPTASPSSSVTPTTSPSSSVTPTASHSSSASPSSTAMTSPTPTAHSTRPGEESGGHGEHQGEELAKTGSGLLLMALACLGLLVLGGAALTSRRQPRRH